MKDSVLWSQLLRSGAKI